MTRIFGSKMPETDFQNLAEIKPNLTGNNPFTKGISTGNLWVENTELKAAGDSENADKQQFRVKKSLDADDLKRELLRGHFHFSDEDIKAFEAKYGEFIVNDEQKCTKKNICTRATKQDIEGWATKNGKVSIDLTSETVKQLTDFRQERAIDRSAAKIADPILRETVKTELLNLATGEGQTRVDAARKLADADAATFDDAEAVRNAIRQAASEPEAQNNASLQILSAKVDLEKAAADKQNAFSQMVNSKGDFEKNANFQILQKKVAAYENRLNRAIDAASGIDARTKQRTINVNRAESAFVNLEAAELYKQLGEPQKAFEREMMSRYYTMDERERNSMEFKISKPRVGLDGTIYGGKFYTKYKTDIMQAAPENQLPAQKIEQPKAAPNKDFSEDPFKRETNRFEKRFKIVEQRFNGSKTQTKVEHGTVRGYERNYQIEGSLRTEGKENSKVREYQAKSGKNAPIILDKSITVTQTHRGPELNKAGIVRANVAGGAAALLQEFNTWFPIVVDVYMGYSKIKQNQLEKIKSEVFLRDNYLVPPEPKDLPRIKLRLEREYGKENAAIVMKKLEEMSYAAYGK